MMQYIDKDALVAKIDSLKHKIDDRYSYSSGWKDALRMVEVELDNLEVNEVNLEKEIDDWYNTMGIPVTTDALKETARYFFKLGLKTQQGE